MPADAVGARELLRRLCTYCQSSGTEAVVLCLSRPAEIQPAETSFASLAGFRHGSLWTASFAMRRDAIGFLRLSQSPSQGLPALISALECPGDGGRLWVLPGNFLCPLNPVTVLCLVSRLLMSPRAGFTEVMGAACKGEQS